MTHLSLQNHPQLNSLTALRIEVLVAASLMVILAVGVLLVFSYAVKLNAGNNFWAAGANGASKEVRGVSSDEVPPGSPPERWASERRPSD